MSYWLFLRKTLAVQEDPMVKAVRRAGVKEGPAPEQRLITSLFLLPSVLVKMLLMPTGRGNPCHAF